MKIQYMLLLIPLLLIPVYADTPNKSVGTQDPHIILIESSTVQIVERFVVSTEIRGQYVDDGKLVTIGLNQPTELISFTEYLVLLQVTGLPKVAFESHVADYVLVNNGYLDTDNKQIKFPMAVTHDQFTGYVEDVRDLNNVSYSIPDEDSSQRINIILSKNTMDALRNKLVELNQNVTIPESTDPATTESFMNDVRFYDFEGNEIIEEPEPIPEPELDLLFQYAGNVEVTLSINGEPRPPQTGYCYTGEFSQLSQNVGTVVSNRANVWSKCVADYVQDKNVISMTSAYGEGAYRTLIIWEAKQ